LPCEFLIENMSLILKEIEMSETNQCPKCGFASEMSFPDCPKCGIVVSKFLAIEKKRKEFESAQDVTQRASSGILENAQGFMIKQEKEWGEILTGFETKNKYDVMDNWGNRLFRAEEEGGGFGTVILRNFLEAWRPFTINIFSADGMDHFILKRPFRFYFYELEVRRSDGMLMGKIVRRFSILRRIYSVFDKNGQEVYELFGPLLHPWTFLIRRGQQELGKIVKKWSGLAKESFTDADNFGITFPTGIDIDTKAILLGAVFLLDFVHFESNRSSGNAMM